MIGIFVPLLGAMRVHQVCAALSLLSYDVERTYSLQVGGGTILGRITEFESTFQSAVPCPAPPQVSIQGVGRVVPVLERTVARSLDRSKPILSVEVDDVSRVVTVNVDGSRSGVCRCRRSIRASGGLMPGDCEYRVLLRER